jgi:hypothetical protein
VVITPKAASGYVLARGSHPFTIQNTFRVADCAANNPPPPPVVAAKPTPSLASCAHVNIVVSLPKTPHVRYVANGSLTVAPGKSVTITAVADKGYRLAVASERKVISNTFDVSKCGAALAVSGRISPPPSTPQLAATGRSSMRLPAVTGALLVLLGGLLTFGGYLNRRNS